MRGAPHGTVTFLFTDIESSTRLWEQWPDAMQSALAAHDRILRAAVAAHDGYVFSTAGDALLSVADPDTNAASVGHLVNGAFVLAQPLQARARNAANQGTAFNNVGSSASPLNLLTWNAPISNDQVTLEFSQLVNANDSLRTGTYDKALTFTLSTTTP